MHAIVKFHLMDATVRFDFMNDSEVEAAYGIVLLNAGKYESAMARFKRASEKATK